MKKQDKINAKRISRAIVGLQIPLLEICALNKHLEAAIARGVDDNDLRLVAVLFLKHEPDGN